MKRVLSVGQCAADHALIRGTLDQAFEATVDPVATHADALARLHNGGYALVLVNRVGDADGAAGLDLIRQLKSDDRTREVPVLLVSNYPEFQAEAVALGAIPGFGKASLGDPATLDRVRPFLG